jgi:hypothetical protein
MTKSKIINRFILENVQKHPRDIATVLAEKFKTIMLDFKGVSSMGQAFVDEVFRVFHNEYPDITIHYVNANEEVVLMIKRGLSNR